MSQIYASVQEPFLLFRHKGVCYGTNKVIRRTSPTLRSEHRKFWSSLIKASRHTSSYRGRTCASKDILWSYALLPFINNRLKVTVRTKPFSSKLVDKII